MLTPGVKSRRARLLPRWAVMRPFDEAAELSRIGLITPDRSPLSPLAAAALAAARRVALPGGFGPT